MSAPDGFRRWLKLPRSVRSLERDVTEELEFHLHSRVDELVASGFDRASARERALSEFGDLQDATRELAGIDRRREGRRRWSAGLAALRDESAAAVRSLRRVPGFTATVAMTLALGIAANATMFGVIDRLMLRPAPHVHDGDRLRRVFVRLTSTRWGIWTQPAGSYPVVTALQQDPTFATAAAWSSSTGSIGRGRDAQQGDFLLVTPSLFQLTGVRPQLGRFFTDGDSPHAAVLGYSFWQRHYGADESIVGKSIDAFGQTYTVLGVAPRGYRGLGTRAPDVFVPISSIAPQRIGANWATTTSWFWLDVAAKLAPGVSLEQARTRAELLYRRVFAEDSTHNRAEAILASVIPGRAPDPRAEWRVAVWLVGVALVVLVIATANVANLLLTRAARRRREIAVRVALGVSRWRLVLRLFAESVLLAVLGSIGALLITYWGGSLVHSTLLGAFSPDDPIVDMRVFVVTTVAALVAGVAAGLVPALQATRPNTTDALKDGGRSGTFRRSRLRVGLLVAQATLSLVLVAGAALFVRSLSNALNEPLGMDPQQVLVAEVDLGTAGFAPARQRAIYDRALEHVTRLPEVASAALTTTVPFRSSIATELRVEGVDSLPRFADGGPYISRVGPAYFTTLGMRAVRGRTINGRDASGAPPVAVVSETMARRVWSGRDPIGTCLFIGENATTCTRVVGIVNDARRQSFAPEDVALYYTPLAQDTVGAMRTLLVRVRGDARRAVIAVQRTMQNAEPALPFADVRLLQDLIDPQLRPFRLGATLFVVFGGVALLLAAVGLFSVVSYDTTQRTQEIGVRLALGAGRQRILRLVLLDGLRSAGLGALLGLAIAIASGRALASLLYNVSPRDPWILGTSVALLLLVAMIACLVPAVRATNVAPNHALRAE